MSYSACTKVLLDYYFGTRGYLGGSSTSTLVSMNILPAGRYNLVAGICINMLTNSPLCCVMLRINLI